MPISLAWWCRSGSAVVPEDEQVLGLATGDDEVGLAVAVEVGGLEIFDRDLLGRQRARSLHIFRT